MKQFLLLFFFLLLITPAFSQKTQTETESTDEDAENDDDFGQAIKIMIIPFNPSYYKRDVSADVKEYQDKFNEKKSQEIKAWFSFGLDENIAPRILTLNNPDKKVLLNDFSSGLDDDIKVIYSNIEYRYEKRDKKYAKKNSALVSNVMGKLKQSKVGTEMNVEEDYESDKKHKEYMNVYIADPTVLPHVAERYGVQLFVFINQFEVFTDYKKCIDKENKIYQRQIKLHFSIFDKDGEQIYGDLATINFYPTASKDIDNIIMERFPVVANYFKSIGDGAGQ